MYCAYLDVCIDMAAYDVFIKNGAFNAWVMQRNGCFSVDREGSEDRPGAFEGAQGTPLLSGGGRGGRIPSVRRDGKGYGGRGPRAEESLGFPIEVGRMPPPRESTRSRDRGRSIRRAPTVAENHTRDRVGGGHRGGHAHRCC